MASWASLIFLAAEAFGGMEVPSASFQGEIFVSPDLYFHDQWYHVPSNSGPQLVSLDRAARGQTVAIYALFRGYATNPKGHVKLEFDLRIDKPDGKKYLEQQKISAYDGEKKRKEELILWNGQANVSFEESDPLGEYVVTIKAYDRMGKTSSSAKKTILLTEDPAPEAFEGDDELSVWFMGYYQRPEPLRLASAFQTSVRLGHWEETDRSEMLRSFFSEAFRAQPKLLRRLVKDYEKYDADAQESLLLLLARGNFETSLYLDLLSETAAREISKMRENPFFDLEKSEITEPHHLDMLWMHFFATGLSAPILRLCKVFENQPEGWNQEGEKGLTPEALLYKAAAWSVRSNIERNPRIRKYITSALQRQQFNREAHTMLAALLKIVSEQENGKK